MQLSTLLVTLAVVLVIGVFICFPQARKLWTGFIRLFIKDIAETPEGAAAIYEEAVHETQEKYNLASDALRTAAGRLASEQKVYQKLKEDLAKVEKQCEDLVKAGHMGEAEIKVEERAELMADIRRSTQLIKAYQQAKDESQTAFEHWEKELRRLKREKREIVDNMRVKNQLKEVYDDMEDLKKTTATSKLLDNVKEKNKDLNSEIEGAKILHENKLSTKVDKANAKARQVADDEYLASLKKKYNR